MSDWEDIETAPHDGTPTWVRRMYQGLLVSEGWAVWDIAHAQAPQRESLGRDPLGRLSPTDYAREAADRLSYADTPKWLKPDRMYSFPTPTEWMPSKSPK